MYYMSSFVVCYSFQEGKFIINTLEEEIQKNSNNILNKKGKKTDSNIICIFNKLEDALQYVQNYQDIIVDNEINAGVGFENAIKKYNKLQKFVKKVFSL